jgi:hypothetical protein
MRNLRTVKSIVLLATRTAHGVHELVFRVIQTNNLLRTTRFAYQDCDVLNAVFDEDGEDVSLLRLRPKIFAHVLQNMHRSPEIALSLQAHALSIKSHFPPEVLLMDYRVIMNTDATVNVQEFDVYDFRSSRPMEELVFCSKEVSIVFFAVS